VEEILRPNHEPVRAIEPRPRRRTAIPTVRPLPRAGTRRQNASRAHLPDRVPSELDEVHVAGAVERDPERFYQLRRSRLRAFTSGPAPPPQNQPPATAGTRAARRRPRPQSRCRQHQHQESISKQAPPPFSTEGPIRFLSPG